MDFSNTLNDHCSQSNTNFLKQIVSICKHPPSDFHQEHAPSSACARVCECACVCLRALLDFF